MGKVLIFKDADFSQNAIDGDKDYVLADSVTFDGSHYINIGRGLTQQSKFEICFTPTVGATGRQIIALMGVRTAALYNTLDMRIMYYNSNNLLAVNMQNDGDSTTGAININLAINNKHTACADIKNNNIYLDDTLYPNNNSVTGFDTGANNIYIGAYNSAGTIPSAFTFFQGKVHWIKIYDNSTLSNFYNAATVKATGTFCLVDRLHDENKYYFVTQ